MIRARDDIHQVGITGAGGNLGSTLVDGLVGSYTLRLFDIVEMGAARSERSVRVDFAEQQHLAGVFDGLDALVHLAGDPRPDAPPERTLRNNFRATSYVLEEARRAGVKKIVFASSNFVHQGSIAEALQGRRRGLITLDTPPTPQCLYAESKVFGENVGRHLSHLGMQFAALRIGWSVPQDNPRPYAGAYMRAMFCSKRDLVQAFAKALTVDSDFLVAFAISDNDRKLFDLSETTERLGFQPQDNAEDYF